MDTPSPTASESNSSSLMRKLGKLCLSVFIIWHVVGISIVGPTDTSYMRDNLMKFYGNYLSLINLDAGWPFYAPNPFLGSILSYEVVTKDGQTFTYPLTHAREKFDHAYFRYTNFYAYLFLQPQYSKNKGYDKSVARYLCSLHSSKVAAINFILKKQKRLTYINYQQGYRPLDSIFLTSSVIGPYKC